MTGSHFCLKFFTFSCFIFFYLSCESKSENSSVVSDYLRPHALYSPWNSPGQNTRVGSLSLLQGVFPTQGSNTGLLHCRRILYQLSHKGSPQRASGKSQVSMRHSSCVSLVTGVGITRGINVQDPRIRSWPRAADFRPQPTRTKASALTSPLCQG